MCGLAGIILGNKHRSEDDFEWIKESMTSLLIRSQARGPHATGIAVIRRDGSYQLLKRPVPAEEFVETEEYEDLMAEIDNDVTILMDTHGLEPSVLNLNQTITIPSVQVR